MCLSRLTVKRTLKKDLVAWKAVGKDSEGRIVSANQRYILSKGRHTESSAASLYTDEHFIHEEGMVVKQVIDIYKTGFHCFLKREDAMDWTEERMTVRVVVPAGTEVQYGHQGNHWPNEVRVVVTPVMIVP